MSETFKNKGSGGEKGAKLAKTFKKHPILLKSKEILKILKKVGYSKSALKVSF